ncbi:hypothetical protein MNB_SM-7-347 [hydrothermal vent metagenome]|uniref:Uncharacterized protein n=1 Tax=hydrothermal vent metagenome TaxID=652676 RepID=A0A1W1BR98_9ZZZZ
MIAIVIESAKKGKSEKNHLIRVLGLKKKEDNLYIDKASREVVFYQMGGKGELLKEQNYTSVVQKAKQLFFVLDADEEYEKTKKDIKILLSSLKQRYQVDGDYFISCDPDTKKGNIETLLLTCIKNPKLKECYSAFLSCMGKEHLERYSEKNILSKLFEIENPPYDLECKYFQDLKKRYYNLKGA